MPKMQEPSVFKDNLPPPTPDPRKIETNNNMLSQASFNDAHAAAIMSLAEASTAHANALARIAEAIQAKPVIHIT
jgi:hypothetical protein